MRRVKEKEDISELVESMFRLFPPWSRARQSAPRVAKAEKSGAAARVHVLLPVEWSRMQKAVPEITTCPRALDAKS